ncbi:uncharacterized protein LOC121238140 [Juglans microcarpa x Juglans regia]|uniref:uncharacterized protein LOC121238140 n=1 Tax=Juglans microcarpa x Juglans regia TaxID=2249226 RepID=UPI001B7F218D|nr:uncharacterized protein LOC121238140 [Juglans microcarpa x Juglans regia]
MPRAHVDPTLFCIGIDLNHGPVAFRPMGPGPDWPLPGGKRGGAGQRTGRGNQQDSPLHPQEKDRGTQRAWAKELPSGLWAYRTIVRTLTGETPFALTYESEAVILVEVGMPTFRVQHFDPVTNDEKVAENLDILEERKEEAAIQTTNNKRKVEQYFNKRVRPRSFKVGDMVLREAGVITPEEGKLGARWEGPYVVMASNRPGSYRLKDSEGRDLPHPWNAEHLKKFYI